MRFLIYKDTGEARLSQKMRQIWTPQVFNHFHSSCDLLVVPLSFLRYAHPPHAQAASPSLREVGDSYPRPSRGQK